MEIKEISKEIKEVKKVIAISDIHLGEKNCLLHKPGLIELFTKQLTEEAQDREIDELIIIGDCLELALVSFHKTYEKAENFFSKIAKIDRLKKIIYLPGNHDHHIWMMLLELTQIVERIEEGRPPLENYRRVNKIYKKTFLDKVFKKDTIITYPNLLRNIGGKTYFFHHGHLMETLFTPSRLIISPSSLDRLEALNAQWLETLWYSFSTDKMLREFIDLAYVKIYLNITNFLSYFSLSRLTNAVFKLKGQEIKSISYRIKNYLNICEKDYHKIPDYFFFGHTHRKSLGVKIQVGDKNVDVYNTGGWNGIEEQACYFVIEEGKEPRLMYLNENMFQCYGE